jgi:hypothetical protein
MGIIRGQPASGKPRRIVCTGWGKRAAEAGVAVRESAVEEGYGVGFEGSGLPSGPMMMIDDEDAHPLCEECVTAWERAHPERQNNAQHRSCQ